MKDGIDRHFTLTLESARSDRVGAPTTDISRAGLTAQMALDVFDAQLGSRHLDLAARELRARGIGYYTIGSAGHEFNAAVAVALRPTDPALLHYTEQGVRGFLVPTQSPGFSAPDIKAKLSLRASITSELVLDDVRLPASAMLPLADGLKGPLSCLNEARFGIVFGAVGAARDCLHCAIDYADSRVVFDKPLAAHQLTQAKLADMALEVGKAYLLALHLGRLKDSGGLRPEQVSLGKLNNVREAIAVARQARTILGANGITLEYPVMRHAANLESVLTYEGTSEMHQLSIGNALTGFTAFR